MKGKKIILVADGNHELLRAIHEVIQNGKWEVKSLKDFPPGRMFRYQCQTCGNTCLQETRPDNNLCQPDCNKPDWKLLKIQENYKVGEADFGLLEGEV